MTRTDIHEQKFFKALNDIFVGAKIEGESGYINLMRIKSRYYTEGIFPHLKKDIDQAITDFPEFREELFDKLYTFFQRYFSESGSIYFRHTALHQNIYEKVYTDDRDVVLFWKTHMLYYVKTDRLFKSMLVEVEGKKFWFDASQVELKRANEKRDVIFAFRERRADDTLVFDVNYSERGSKSREEEILKALKKEGVGLSDELLNQAFRVFEKQSEVDFFINKDARSFLREQFDLWMYQYLFEGQNVWSAERLAQLQTLKAIACKVIDFISQFEDELVKVWNKPKFVRNSHYVITLDKLQGTPVAEKIMSHPNFPQQLQEWRDLGMVDDDFSQGKLNGKNLIGESLHPRYQYLPVDTKYFPDIEFSILSHFDNLDTELDGWLIHSENYQYLLSSRHKFSQRVKTIYIDPPYNTAASEIMYTNNYKHSAWLSMMIDRVGLSKEHLDSFNGFLCCTIDDVEQNSLSILLENEFGDIAGTLVIQIKPSGRPIPNGFALSHEYALFSRSNKAFPVARLQHSDSQVERYKERDDNGPYFWEMLRKAGSNSSRSDRPTMFFPFRLSRDTGQVRVPIMAWDDKDQRYTIKEKLQENDLEIYPKKDDGSEGCWYFGLETARKICVDIKVEEKSKGNRWLYYKRRPNEGAQPTTVWTDSKYSATEHGTALLKNLFGEYNAFTYPKSIHAVMDCLRVTNMSDFKEAIVLDYFAGSGTTAHAVMNLNREDSGKRKYILVEMGEHFNTVILPRIKKIAFNSKWKDGKPVFDKNESGMSHFVKYYELEQYEDVLQKARYADSDLFDDPNQDPYHNYVFRPDLKLLHSLEIDAEAEKVHFHPERLYPDIDLAETLSHLRGKWIKRITKEFVEFEDGEQMSLTDPDWQTLKPMIWWQ